jgi:predicted DNA-binding transcriptional regulator YafY
VSRSGRLLLLLQSLRRRRRAVTAAQLACEFEVSERTIYRDLAELAAQGAPVEGEAGVGYVLRPGFFLPPLTLNVEEAEAVLLGLHYVEQRGDDVLTKSAADALAKITSVLSQAGQDALAVPLAMPGPPGYSFPENVVPLKTLRAAIRSQSRLELNYRDADGKGSRRVVWPVQLAFTDSVRILAAWCELRREFRMFRTDRILSAVEVGPYPGRRADLMRDLKTHLQTSDRGNHS